MSGRAPLPALASHGPTHTLGKCRLKAAAYGATRLIRAVRIRRIVGERQQGIHERPLAGRKQNLDDGVVAILIRAVRFGAFHAR